MDQQQQWASTLKKTQHQTKKRKHVPLEEDIRHLDEEMDYYKQQLIQTAEKKKFDKAKKNFTKLVELRARQVRLNLEKIEQTSGKPSKDAIDKEVTAYERDYLELALAADKLLGIEYKV